jgi:hypothetical protein
MKSSRPRTVALDTKAATSRREFLRYGGAAVGASIFASSWPRFARAQTYTFNYFISPTGSDSNSGTSHSSPWALTSCLPSSPNNKKMAGQRVGFMPGTYSVMTLTGISQYPSDYSNPYLSPPGGSAGSSTVWASCDSNGNYSPRTAVLDGQGTASNNPNSQPLLGSINGNASSYITIDGFEIINGYYHPIAMGYTTGGYWTITTRCSGIVIQNCYIHQFTNVPSGQNPTGITLYATSGAVIQNNYITDISDASGRATGIEVWNTDNVTIQYNSVISTSSQQVGGIFLKNEGCYQATVRYNYVNLTASGTAASGSGGLCADLSGTSSNTSYFYGNIIISDNPVFSYAISVAGWPNTAENQTWYNNTFVGIPGSSQVFAVRYGAPGTIRNYNNIFYTTSVGFRGVWCTSASASALSDYNMYDIISLGLVADGSNSPPQLHSSISSFAGALPSACVGKEAHSISANPLFVATGSGPAYYQLQSGSPCAGKGSTTGITSGAPTNMGAWGNGATQIGASFAPGGTTGAPPPVPVAPTLTVK